jgi:hypothetical protein
MKDGTKIEIDSIHLKKSYFRHRFCPSPSQDLIILHSTNHKLVYKSSKEYEDWMSFTSKSSTCIYLVGTAANVLLSFRDLSGISRLLHRRRNRCKV